MTDVKLTKRQLELITDGLLALIENANKAYCLVSSDDASRNAIVHYREELQKLNSQLCAIEWE